MSSETFKQFAIRLQKTARHTDISELDLVQIAITGATNDNLRSHLLMAAPANMNNLIKLPVVCNDDLNSNASLEQISLLTATVSQLKSQAPLLSNRISVIHGSRINYETICCPQFCTYSYQILCHVGGTIPPT